MKSFFSKILISSFLLITIHTFGQEQLYPKIIENNQEFYLYQVLQGEGLWSISKKFGVTQNEIHQYNPEIAQGLKYGLTLKIPVRKQVTLTKEEQNKHSKSEIPFKTHMVEKSQTLYSIAKLYNVSMDAIIANNPTAANGLKIGEVLKIPTTDICNKDLNEIAKNNTQTDTSTFILHEVKKKETLYSISKKYGVEINSILEHNDIKGFPKKGDILRIKIKKESIPQLQVDTTVFQKNTAPQNYKNLDDTLKNAFKIGILLPFKLEMAGTDKNAEKFIEFYRGILLAINDAKKQGNSFILHVYDTGNSEEKIDSIIKKEELKTLDLIIGPAYTNQIPKVTDFAKQYNTPIVIPFSQKVKDIENNPFIIQFNSPQQDQITIAKNKLLDKIKNRPIVFALFENNNDDGNSFANALQVDFLIKQIPHKKCIITEQNADSVCQLAINQNALLLLASSTQERVKPILRIINRHRLGTNLELIGFDKWGLSLLNESRPIYFTSLFNPNTNLKQEYKEKYETFFGITNNAYPNFDQLGYDLMRNMIGMLKNSKNKHEFIFPTLNNVQSDMNFKKTTHEGGWINEHLYLIHLK